MKKSTYILIGFLGAMCLLSFLIPPLLFRNRDSRALRLSENYVSKDVPEFSVIHFKNPNLGGKDPLFIINATTDSLQSGHIEINEAFAGLKDCFSVSGDTLYINMNLDEEYTEHRYYEDTDKAAAILYASLKNLRTVILNPHIDVEVNGLDGAGLNVCGRGTLIVSESNIRTMGMMPKDDNSYHGRYLLLKDNTNIGKLEVMNDGFYIKTIDSHIDTISVLSECSVNLSLEEVEFSTLITADSCRNVNLTFNGGATLSRQ